MRLPGNIMSNHVYDITYSYNHVYPVFYVGRSGRPIFRNNNTVMGKEGCYCVCTMVLVNGESHNGYLVSFSPPEPMLHVAVVRSLVVSDFYR